MKAQGIIKGGNIILKKTSSVGKLHDGDMVEVIILPVEKKQRRFSTFKLGVKKEYLKREKVYAKS